MADVSTTSVATRSSGSSPAKETDGAAEKVRFLEEMTSDVDAVQERVLAEILGRNAESEYLAKCGLAGATDRATFRAKVPMVAYEDLVPYIRRVAYGDRSPILTGPEFPISEFLTSSGTSGGERKLLPSVKDDDDRRQLLESLRISVMMQYVPPGQENTGRVLYFLFVHPETKTPGGLPARTVATSICRSQHFKNASHAYTSPVAAFLCEDAFQSMYAMIMCGLCQRYDVSSIAAMFAASLVRAIRFLQLNWEQLAADIEAGVLNPRVADQSVREAVAGILLPDPNLAQFIRAECSKDDWAGIIKRIWPNTRYLRGIVTGSMAQYVPALNYYSGGLPVVSTVYASSECVFGLNLRPFCDPSEVSYTIMPNMGYFEFLPAGNSSDNGEEGDASRLVELARLETGREYEIVVTTYAGLYRYRVGDVLRVTGFHNSAPQLRFVRRKNVVLSVDSDKTDEAELQRAVERASALLRPHRRAVVEYTSRVCVESIPGHYVIYWELMMLDTKEPRRSGNDAVAVNGGVLERCCLEMEAALSSVYRRKRAVEGSIAPLEIRVLRSGTFEEIMDLAVSRGTSVSQYKVPRCVDDSPHIIELLDSRVVSSHFSSVLPYWHRINTGPATETVLYP